MGTHQKKAVTYTLWLAMATVLVLIISVMIKFNAIEGNDRDTASEETKDALLSIVSKNAPRRGAVNPSVIIVEFGDFQCSFCKDVAPVIEETLHNYAKDVQLVWLHANNPDHPQAKPAAIASQCAQEQNQFWSYHDLLFQSQEDLSPSVYNQIALSLNLDMQKFQTCLADPQIVQIVETNYQYARASNVDATPYLNVNDQTFSGVFTSAELERLIQNAL